MPAITILLSACLISLGLIGYFELGRHFTALIPAFFGLIFLLCGMLAHKQAWRKHAMHVAVGLALLGFLATVRSYIDMILIMSQRVEWHPRYLSKAIMATLCLVFLTLAIRSFIRARRIQKNNS